MAIDKVKIVFSNYDDRKNPSYGGGGAIAIHEVASRLATDYQVTVLTGTYLGALPTEVIDGVQYKRIGTMFFGPKISQLLFALSLPWYVISETYDLWIENLTPPLGPAFLPLFTFRPVIALVHMLPGMDMWRKYRIPFFLFERLGLKLYRDFIVLSKETQKTIKRYNPRASVHIIPNGVTLPETTEEHTPKHILFLGRIEVNQKGLDLLIKAYSKIAKDIPYPLVIAGDGANGEVEKLKILIAESDCAERITLMGRVDGEYKANLFQEAVMVIIPSRFESFCLVALEALAYGLPVITFDIDGFKWLPSELLQKVAPLSVDDLSNKILHTLMPSTRGIKEQRLAFAARYRWENVAEMYRELLRKYIREPASPAATEPAQKFTDQMNIVFQDIIKHRVPCFFISPHLDDAALSCGDLMSYLVGKTDVTVATVFTQATDGKCTLSAQKFLNQCRYKNAQELFSDRRAEDRAALESLGVRVAHMGFPDALWRKRNNPSIWRRFLGKCLAEFTAVYPTYRFHARSGKISIHDFEITDDIKEKLRALTAGLKDYYVFCPQALGGHVDHIIVQKACQETFRELIIWSDFPYNLQGTRQTDNVWLWDKNRDRKRQLIMVYRTQVGAMFPENKIPLIPEAYTFEKYDGDLAGSTELLLKK